MKEGPFSRRRRHHLLVLKVTLAVVTVDALSKTWALWALNETPWRLPGISLQVSYDPGALFWLGPAGTPVLAILHVLVVGVLAVLRGGIANVPWALAAGLAAGGATGNFIDRLARPPGLLHGAAVEWINLLWINLAWIPALDLADVAVGLAAAIAVSAGGGRVRG